MSFSDEQVRDMLEIKERTIQKIEKYEREIQLLEKQLAILDSIVKQSSFAKASSLPKAEEAGAEGGLREQQQQRRQQQRPAAEEEEVGAEGNNDDADADDSIPITHGNGGRIIAGASVTPEQITITLDESLDIDEGTSPFRSFFLGRIIGEMKRKDAEDPAVPDGSAVDCIVNRDGSSIREIIVKNYRQKERVKEIISTAGWSLSRMLDNADR